jgi:hydroxyacylglutathione hydrolase
MLHQTEIIPLGHPFARCFALRGDGVVLVDTSLPGSAPGILRRLARQGVKPRDIKLILLTHAHQDHFGSQIELRQASGAPVAVHAQDAPALTQGAGCSMTPLTRIGRRMVAMLEKAPPDADPAREADLLVDEGHSLEAYGVAGKVLHLPGHTPGHLGVWLDQGAALIGDMLMRRYFAFGGAWRPYIVNDTALWRDSLSRLAALKPALCHGAHIAPLRLAQLERAAQCARRDFAAAGS